MRASSHGLTEAGLRFNEPDLASWVTRCYSLTPLRLNFENTSIFQNIYQAEALSLRRLVQPQTVRRERGLGILGSDLFMFRIALYPD